MSLRARTSVLDTWMAEIKKGISDRLGTWSGMIGEFWKRHVRLDDVGSLLFDSSLYPGSCSKFLLVTCCVPCDSVTLHSCLSTSEIQWDCVRAATVCIYWSFIRSSTRVPQPAVVEVWRISRTTLDTSRTRHRVGSHTELKPKVRTSQWELRELTTIS